MKDLTIALENRPGALADMGVVPPAPAGNARAMFRHPTLSQKGPTMTQVGPSEVPWSGAIIVFPGNQSLEDLDCVPCRFFRNA
jgi:hypothetical protein